MAPVIGLTKGVDMGLERLNGGVDELHLGAHEPLFEHLALF